MVEDLITSFDVGRARAHLAVLAGPDCCGRAPGTPGEHFAADYLVEALVALGAEPLQLGAGFCDPFDLVVADLEGAPQLAVHTPTAAHEFSQLVDYTVNVQGAAGPGKATAPTVWLPELGVAPLGIDLTGRIGVCPGTRWDGASAHRGLERYLRQLRAARDARALGLLRVTDGPLVRKAMIHLREQPTIPSLDVSPTVSRALFESHPPESGQEGHDCSLAVPLRHQRVRSIGNVVASVGRGRLRLMLVAHYDHVGAVGDGRYFQGATDNAGSVAVVLEALRVVAAHAADLPFRVAAVFTSGEEVGLVGVRHFLNHFPDSFDRQTVVVNLDGVGGPAEAPLLLLSTRDFTRLASEADSASVGSPLELRQLGPGGFADHVPFLERGVSRVASLLTRPPEPDVVHTLRDTADRIAAQSLLGAGRLLLLIAARLTEPDPPLSTVQQGPVGRES